MSYADLLTDRCDVYHMQKEETNGAYGVPGETDYIYPPVPDSSNVPCLFVQGRTIDSSKIIKNEPGISLLESFKVHFFIETDVRLNDKVIFDGVVYRLEIPRKIRDHHIEVTAIRDDSI